MLRRREEKEKPEEEVARYEKHLRGDWDALLGVAKDAVQRGILDYDAEYPCKLKGFGRRMG